MSSIRIQLGKNIRVARKNAGLSQEALALQAKIDRSYMGRIERGEANITIELLYKVASIISIPPKDLLP